MKLRLASLAFLLSSIATGLTWLTLQPTMWRLAQAVARLTEPGSPDHQLLERVRIFLPYALGLNLVVVGGFTYAVLYLLVGRPLEGTEALIEHLEHLELDLPNRRGGGPLMARLRGSLQRTAQALREAQRLQEAQVEELRDRNAALAAAQTELWAAERLATVGKLAAGVAHEVGNPLAGILGYLSLARDRAKADAELGDYLQRIEGEVLRIDGIVRGLLDLGRPAPTEQASLDVGALLSSSLQLVKAGPDFAEIEIEYAPPQGLWAKGASGPLAQIVINLLLNAAQAMGGKGTIRVSAALEGEWVEVRVKDQGPGVPSDVLPHIFEPFFTTKPSGIGTGLGLAISLHLTASMGGTLSASNPAEGGALFVVGLRPA